MDKFDKYVAYGEVSDFNENGSFKTPNNYPTIVMLGAPWCGHCKHLKPIFADCAERLAGKVRCITLQESGEQPTNTEACKIVGKVINLRGYPTLLKLNTEGNIVGDYDGQRTVDAICQWALQ